MKCDLCEDKATVFYTQVADGKMKKTALCESCAQQQGITDPNGLLMVDQLMGTPASSKAEPEVLPIGSTEECPTCGFTLEDYQKVGRLGCGDCYSAFSAEIEQRLPSLHKGLNHEGRVPSGLAELEVQRGIIDELNKRLEQAVAEENYEVAAQLRDELKSASEKKVTTQEESAS